MLKITVIFNFIFLTGCCICNANGNEVTGVIGNIHVCSLSMKISGAGHDLLSTCRYQTNNSIHISPTIHSNCSLTSTNYNWKIYWLNNQDALVNIEKHMVDLTMEDNAPFTIPSAYVLEAEADSKGIFALSLKMDFELNGINTNSEQKVYMMFTCSPVSKEDKLCTWTENKMAELGITTALQEVEKCEEMVVKVVEIVKETDGQWSVIKSSSVTEKICECVLLRLMDWSDKFEVKCNTSDPDLPKLYDVYYRRESQDEKKRKNWKWWRRENDKETSEHYEELLKDNTFPDMVDKLDDSRFKVVVKSTQLDGTQSTCTDYDIQCGGRIFQQTISIPMGTNCAPLLAAMSIGNFNCPVPRAEKAMILKKQYSEGTITETDIFSGRSGGNIKKERVFPGRDIGSNNSAVEKLMNSGNYSGAVNALNDVLSVLNTDNSTSQSSKKEKKEIRKAIVNSLRKVNVSSLDDLTMVTDVLNSAVSVSDEMSEEAQDTALDVYTSLTSILTQQVNNSVNGSTKGESAAGLLLNGLSNVLDYNTGIVTEELTITSNHTEVNQSHLIKVEENTKSILNLVDNIADVALALTPPSETPVVFETPHMNLAVMKNTVANTIGKKLENTKSLDGTNLVGSFKLPSDAAFSDKLSGIEGDVNLQMMLMSKNPFVWHPSAKTVTTPVVSMKVKDSNRNLVKVQGLQEPIHIQISNQGAMETTVFTSKINLVFKNGTYRLRDGKGPTFKLDTNITDGYSLVLTVRGQELECPFRLVEATENMTDPRSEPGLLLNNDNNYMMIGSLAETANQLYSVYILPVLNSSSTETFLTEYAIRNNYTMLCAGSVPCKGEITLPMNFSMETYSVRCTYWNEVTEMWTSDGCKVSEETTKEVIHCDCYHLTSFSGSFIVLPNAINPFADAVLFLNFFDNPLVVSTVVFVWFIYFSAVYWAKKADRRDNAQTGIVVLSDTNPIDPYQYLMCVVTGWWAGAETTARISCYVSGNRGHSMKHCLSDSVVNKGYFKAGWEDWFLFTSPYHLGNLESVTMWHDNSGTSPSWFLTRVMIQDLKTNKVYNFILGDWIGVERGSTKVTIPHTKPEDIGNFRNQEFTFKSSRDIRDSHLWFSVFSKPCRSQFTRVQRLTCCLSLLLCTMLTSIMFHGMPTDSPEDQATVANFTFSVKDLIIGVECAIIMLPINILIVQLFMRTSKKPKQRRSSRKRYEFIWDVEDSEQENLQINDEKESIIEDLEETPPTQRPKMLPWWCVYIAWTIVILVSLICSYFVMLYGLKYGYQKSLEWLISFFTAFFQSACLQQPLKVIAIAMVMTYICKKPVEIEGMIFDINLKDAVIYEDDGEYAAQHIVPDSASKSVLQQIKTKLQMEGVIEERIRVMIIYFLFVTVVLYAAHGNRNVRKSYWMGSAIEDIFIRQAFKKDRLTFSDATSPPLFWDFLRVKVLPGLDDIYNGDKNVETHGDDFIGVGPFRFRQLRVQSDTCSTPLSVRNSASLSINCLDSYWLGNEDTTHYNQSWSETMTESTNNHWSYQSAWQLGTLPYAGTLATYSGGGYVLVMYPNSSTQQIFDNLRSDSWINERTRALFVEFSLYNPNVNFFSVVMFLFEFSSNGGIVPFYQIFTTRLYHYSSSTKAALVFCEIMFLIFTLIFSYYEFKKARSAGFRQYLSEFWNTIEFIIICLSYSIIGLFFQRMVIVDYLMGKLPKSDGVEFVSFYPAVFWDFVQLYVMSFLVFLVILKFVKILSFNKNMHLLGDTLHGARDTLANFSFLIVVLIFAFTHFAYLVFGSVLAGYKSVIASLVTSFTFALGVSNYYGLYHVNRVLGPIFFVLFILFVMFIYLTVFMAIVNTSITKAKEAKLKRRNEFEVFDYLVIKLANILPVELAAKLNKKKNTKP